MEVSMKECSSCRVSVYWALRVVAPSPAKKFRDSERKADSIANICQGPMAFTVVPDMSLEQAATVATLNSKSAQEIADEFAVSYSTVALSVGARVIRRRPALEAQLRTVQLVTRIPNAPLYTLVVANMLFVIAGVVLGTVALWSSTSGAHDVQSRLSVVGVVADRFEQDRAKRAVASLKEAFEESDGIGRSRVLVQRTAFGGFEYQLLR